MSDLIERLRDRGEAQTYPISLCERAADEIERLQRELAEAQELLTMYNLGGWMDSARLIKERDQLRRELAEARELLREARGPVDSAARYAFGHLRTEVAEDLFALLNRIDAFLAAKEGER